MAKKKTTKKYKPLPNYKPHFENMGSNYTEKWSISKDRYDPPKSPISKTTLITFLKKEFKKQPSVNTWGEWKKIEKKIEKATFKKLTDEHNKKMFKARKKDKSTKKKKTSSFDSLLRSQITKEQTRRKTMGK